MGKITGFLEYERNDRDHEVCRVGKGASAEAFMVGKIVRAPCPPWTLRQTILPTLRLRALFIVAIISLSTGLVGMLRAHACDCPQRLSASALLNSNSPDLDGLPDNSAAFIGRVVAQWQWDDRALSSTAIRVLKTLKGHPPDLVVLAGLIDTSCGIPAYVGKFAVFVVWKQADGEWDTRICEHPREDVPLATLFKVLKGDEQK